MLKKVLLLSISLGTISNSISMDDVIYRYNIPISITMGTVVGIGSRLFTNNIKYNIGIGLGIGIGTYFVSKLFGKDEQTGSDQNSAGEHGNLQVPVGPSAGNGDPNQNLYIASFRPKNGSNAINNTEEIKQYKIDIYNEIINNKKFDNYNQKHIYFLQQSVNDYGGIDILKDLITKGADVNIKNKYSNTLLHIASEEGLIDIVELLVNNNADVNARNNDGYTPLHIASFNGHLNVVEYLISKGAKINANGYCTPLHFASINGNISIVRYLISKGADKDAKDKDNNTPLHNASSNGHLNVVKYLVNNGADINAKDDNARTPLHKASSNEHLSIVEHLISNKADINAKDNDGYTPIDIVLYLCFIHIKEHLINNTQNGDNDFFYTLNHFYYPAIECFINNGADIKAKNKDNLSPEIMIFLIGNIYKNNIPDSSQKSLLNMPNSNVR